MFAQIIEEAIKSGVHLAFIFLVIFFTYAAWRAIWFGFQWKIKQDPAIKKGIIIILKTTFKVSLTLLIATVFIVKTIGWTNGHASQTQLVLISALLNEADHTLFGTYVSWWFQETNNYLYPTFLWLAPIFVYTYQGLSIVLSLIMFLALVIRQSVFYRFIFALVVSTILCLPLWYLFPAATPNQAYWSRVVAVPASNNMSLTLKSYKPAPVLKNFLGNDRRQQNIRKYETIQVTTFPSLHVIWGTVAVWYGILLMSRWKFIFITYGVLNIISTVFTLQHYAVDVLVALPITVLVIWLVEIIYGYYHKKIKETNDFSDIVKKDLRDLRAYFIAMKLIK